MQFFINNSGVERLPSADVRFLNLEAIPDPDFKRLKINLELTPFQQRPEIELTLNDSNGVEVASASIIEPVNWKLELNLHIRKNSTKVQRYTLNTILLYPELGEVDRRTLIIEIPNPAE
jgi:hypothetical protein